MSKISEWRTPEENERFKASRPKRSRTNREATEDQRRLIDLKKEIRAEDKFQKAEQARQELWSWYEENGGAEGLLATAQESAERAEAQRRTQELRQEIETQVLITEVNQEVEQLSEN